MSSQDKYTDAPANIARALASAIVVDDFLPSPDQLILKSEKEKITIAVDKHSLELFRQYAKKHNAKYQPMMDGVLSAYAEKFLRQR